MTRRFATCVMAAVTLISVRACFAQSRPPDKNLPEWVILHTKHMNELWARERAAHAAAALPAAPEGAKAVAVRPASAAKKQKHASKKHGLSKLGMKKHGAMKHAIKTHKK